MPRSQAPRCPTGSTRTDRGAGRHVLARDGDRAIAADPGNNRGSRLQARRECHLEAASWNPKPHGVAAIVGTNPVIQRRVIEDVLYREPDASFLHNAGRFQERVVQGSFGGRITALSDGILAIAVAHTHVLVDHRALQSSLFVEQSERSRLLRRIWNPGVIRREVGAIPGRVAIDAEARTQYVSRLCFDASVSHAAFVVKYGDTFAGREVLNQVIEVDADRRRLCQAAG